MQNRTYQDLINKIDYFKNLKINAIELMPVMEFEERRVGDTIRLSYGLDKFYGLQISKNLLIYAIKTELQ
jgi:1,4-alpha-glucan branching enzyme